MFVGFHISQTACKRTLVVVCYSILYAVVNRDRQTIFTVVARNVVIKVCYHTVIVITVVVISIAKVLIIFGLCMQKPKYFTRKIQFFKFPDNGVFGWQKFTESGKIAYIYEVVRKEDTCLC